MSVNMYYLPSCGYRWIKSSRMHDVYFNKRNGKYAIRHKDTGEVDYITKWAAELEGLIVSMKG